MKAILKTESPKSCEQIANGEKTMLLSKTCPNLEPPFKCYIYVTKNKRDAIQRVTSYRFKSGIRFDIGKVIGEFVCDRIEMVNAKCSSMGIDLFYHDCMKFGCLSESEINRYFGVQTDLRDMKGNGYGLHISELKIYDKPKVLGENGDFKFPCVRGGEDFDAHRKCVGCKYARLWTGTREIYCNRWVTRPPQSYMYVEELEVCGEND